MLHPHFCQGGAAEEAEGSAAEGAGVGGDAAVVRSVAQAAAEGAGAVDDAVVRALAANGQSTLLMRHVCWVQTSTLHCNAHRCGGKRMPCPSDIGVPQVELVTHACAQPLLGLPRVILCDPAVPAMAPPGLAAITKLRRAGLAEVLQAGGGQGRGAG